jgi:hypothetical protein
VSGVAAQFAAQLDAGQLAEGNDGEEATDKEALFVNASPEYSARNGTKTVSGLVWLTGMSVKFRPALSTNVLPARSPKLLRGSARVESGLMQGDGPLAVSIRRNAVRADDRVDADTWLSFNTHARSRQRRALTVVEVVAALSVSHVVDVIERILAFNRQNLRASKSLPVKADRLIIRGEVRLPEPSAKRTARGG